MLFNHIVDIFKDHPELAIFLSLSIGYFIGKIKIKGFSLGSTTGTLIAAILVGQIGVSIDPIIKHVFFALFIFTIGYRVGPQFFASLKSSFKVVLLSVIFCLIGLTVAVIMAKIFGFDPGTAGGLLAGALTQSATIGTTESALQGLNLPAATLQTYESNVAITYAVTYMIGTLSVVILMKSFMPKLLKENLKEVASRYDSTSGSGGDLPGYFSTYHLNGVRAFRVDSENIIGKTVTCCASLFPDRVVLDQVERAGEELEADPEFIFEMGDVVTLAGPLEDLIDGEKIIGQEMNDKKALEVRAEHVSIWVTSKKIEGMTLGTLLNDHGQGLFIKKIKRQGKELPRKNDITVARGDTLDIVGVAKDVDAFVALVGYAERPTDKTDLIFVGLGIILGTMVGLMSIMLHGMPLALGAGGGVLIMGLVFGWLRSVHPTFGFIPSASEWLMQDLGLNLFIAVVGLVAGPKAISSLATAGVSVVIAGTVVALVPHLLTAFIGKKFFKMDLIQIVGVLCGAGTCTAALNAVQDESGSAAPVLFYTPAYAIGNVLLTVWGPVIVAFTS